MKVILSGGGTGGHIYPALTIADQIKKLRPEAEIIFVGTKEGLEKLFLSAPKRGWKKILFRVTATRCALLKLQALNAV